MTILHCRSISSFLVANRFCKFNIRESFWTLETSFGFIPVSYICTFSFSSRITSSFSCNSRCNVESWRSLKSTLRFVHFITMTHFDSQTYCSWLLAIEAADESSRIASISIRGRLAGFSLFSRSGRGWNKLSSGTAVNRLLGPCSWTTYRHVRVEREVEITHDIALRISRAMIQSFNRSLLWGKYKNCPSLMRRSWRHPGTLHTLKRGTRPRSLIARGAY